MLAGCAAPKQPARQAPVVDRSPAPAAPTSPRAPAPAAPIAAPPGSENAGKPGYYTVRPGDTPRPATASAPASASPPAPTPATAAIGDAIALVWPARGPVLYQFDETRSKGVGIGGRAGDPVLAAADGRVVYAGSDLRGYGNLIILKHNNTYLTAYAHNQTLLVREDQTVRQGQMIAEMGSSDADRVKLHFEVRRQGKPIDPLSLLPSR
ncbi:peptidoglycan DD-metalloendopeptidase family protein [Tepidimonas sp.]|uniref:peptidoglycan DD-metalloendopeptidase family protein n=1 Tax=Tepidimonas sp. TaxID=2002775 RepID=UPI002FDFA595